jgi:replicative DNA helicase
MANFDLNECSQDCFDCIKGYAKKHKLTGVEENPFKIPCNGIPEDYVGKDLHNILSEEDREAALTTLDPVAWARENLDWHCFDLDGEVWKRKNPAEYYEWIKNHPGESIIGKSRYHRPYQAMILRCTARRKVMRLGRQCLVGDTKVFLSDGGWEYIKDIRKGDEVLSFIDGVMFPYTVTGHWFAGKKKVFRIKTKFGHIIECTDDHRFITIKKHFDKSHGVNSNNSLMDWSSISTGLKIGSKIGVSYSLPSCECPDEIELAKFLGYFISDGSCSYLQSAKFTNTNSDYLLEFEDLSKFLGTNVKWYKKGNGYDLIISNGRSKKNPVRDLLKEFGLVGITGPQKLIPERIINGSFATMRAFLNRFWSGDGYISTFFRTGRSTQRTEIGTLQENYELVCQIKEMLWKFGVHGYIKEEDNCYRLVVSNKRSVKSFLEYIGPIFGKEEACSKALNNIDLISNKYSHKTKDIMWDYISSIEEVGYKNTWDIEVEGSENFIANGLVTHNSGKSESLVIAMLFNLFTKPGVSENEGFRIIVITPYQAQIELIFNRMDELLRSSPSTINAVESRTKSPPCRLVLSNNSMITGFTAGTKSGGNADSVRGQKANMLVLDEADYLNPNDLDSALSIITNFPNATMWMSSTPKGTREKFYATCHSKIYKEFHFPSFVNPLWNKELEALFREQLTEIGYKHEVLAEFGEQEEGVFQNAYVEAAMDNYEYGGMARNPYWTYMFGVDWNDVSIGTNIVVVGLDPLKNMFYIVDRKIVSRDGWNQLAACNKIAEMNQFWQPAFIYVDSGGPAGGGTQVEILKKFGYDSTIDKNKGPNHSDAKLRNIVKPYSFGGTIEIHDLVTKQPIKKPAKPFLVENAVRRFETGTIKYPASDEVLVKQLLGYIVDHVTTTGVPVYKATDEKIGDHALDGLMLALVAFTLETTKFGKPDFSVDFAFSGKFGEKVEPETEGMALVVASDKKKDPREHNRPTLSRTEEFEEQTTLLGKNKDLPGSHLNRDANGVKLWSWPGFDSDRPKPIRKGLNGTSIRTSKPRRKHF